MSPTFILTLSCKDQRGIVQRVSGFLADHGCNILDSAQFGDAQAKQFFMRVHFANEDGSVGEDQLRSGFGELAQTMGMDWQLNDAARKPRVLISFQPSGRPAPTTIASAPLAQDCRT